MLESGQELTRAWDLELMLILFSPGIGLGQFPGVSGPQFLSTHTDDMPALETGPEDRALKTYSMDPFFFLCLCINP